MWSWPVQHRAEAANDDRVSEAPEQARLPREPPQDEFVLDQVRADELRDDERRQALVPREIGLILVAASELLQREPAGDDLLALLEGPGARLARGTASPPDGSREPSRTRSLERVVMFPNIVPRGDEPVAGAEGLGAEPGTGWRAWEGAGRLGAHGKEGDVMGDERTVFNLDANDLPTAWFNIMPDLAQRIAAAASAQSHDEGARGSG